MGLSTEYLSSDALDGFDKYKYACTDTSPLSVYMKMFWSAIVSRLPRWLAPNLLTLLGWVCITANYILVGLYDPDFAHASSVPVWLWIVCGINQFLGHTMDGCDGIQARRTGSSSPLGELFDHGLDSMGAWMQTITMFSAPGLGPDINRIEMMCVFWAILLGFFMTHIEKYTTSVLYLPWAYDFSQLMVAVSFFFTAAAGNEAWHQPIFEIGGVSFSTLRAFKYIAIFSAIGTVPASYIRMIQGRATNRYSLLEGSKPLLPLAIAAVGSLAWAVTSPSDVYSNAPRVFLTLFGFIFSNIACHMILSQMTNTVFSLNNWILLPLPVFAALDYAEAVPGQTLLLAYVAIAAVAHIHYGTCVVRQLCRHLRIQCFRIPYD